VELMHGSGGTRLAWPQLPAGVRAGIEAAAGSAVVHAVTQPGGFSPGLASRVVLASGERAFVKAVGSARDPVAPRFLRRELDVLSALRPSPEPPSSPEPLSSPELLSSPEPPSSPEPLSSPELLSSPERAGLPIPRLRASYDDGDWIALIFDDVDGRLPALPWRPDELQRVLDAVAELGERLTPTPFDVDLTGRDRMFHGWRELAGGGVPLDGLDPELLPWLDRFAELESRWLDAARGNTLLHGDLRADNLIITPDRVWFVDWPHVSVAAAWVDVVCLVPSVVMQGGPPAEEVWARYRPSRRVDPTAVDSMVAAVAGYFARQSIRPAPPSLPRIREFQRAQGAVAVSWLHARLGVGSA
jgi:Phosphotransferase enzyme family